MYNLTLKQIILFIQIANDSLPFPFNCVDASVLLNKELIYAKGKENNNGFCLTVEGCKYLKLLKDL